jgi:pilus assembly protein Flp/PilA
MRSGRKQFTARIVDFCGDRRAASAAEYAMILALLATGMTIAMLALSNSIDGAMTNTSSVINTAGCSNQGQGTGFGGGEGGDDGQGAGQGEGNTC